MGFIIGLLIGGLLGVYGGNRAFRLKVNNGAKSMRAKMKAHYAKKKVA